MDQTRVGKDRSGTRNIDRVNSPAFDEREGFSIIATRGPAGYRLLDSGQGRKLERFGNVVVDRPEPQAMWRPGLAREIWADAHAVYSASGDDEEKGRWRVDKKVPDGWSVDVGGLPVLCKLQGLWHLGLFPEQLPHWDFMVEKIRAVRGRPARVLNLFAYTGVASMIAASAGAEVTHVDASKKSVQWAKENQVACGLGVSTVRWIVDDAAKFVAREVRRGKNYDVILVDPPKFGRGPSGETWDLFSSLPELLENCVTLLDAKGGSMVLTSYAIRASVLSFEQLCRQALFEREGVFSSGELVLRPDGDGPCVPTSLFVRWEACEHGT